MSRGPKLGPGPASSPPDHRYRSNYCYCADMPGWNRPRRPWGYAHDEAPELHIESRSSSAVIVRVVFPAPVSPRSSPAAEAPAEAATTAAPSPVTAPAVAGGVPGRAIALMVRPLACEATEKELEEVVVALNNESMAMHRTQQQRMQQRLHGGATAARGQFDFADEMRVDQQARERAQRLHARRRELEVSLRATAAAGLTLEPDEARGTPKG